MEKASKFNRYVFTVIVLYVSWILITATTRTDELIVGIIVSLLVAIGTYDYLSIQGLRHLSLKRLWFLVIYIPYYLWQVILANFDMAYRVLAPSMPIKPGFVIVHTDLKTDSGKLALANSITLTPGTLTMDVKDDKLLVHWIYVKDRTIEGATHEICGRFEGFLKVIFG